MIEEEAKRLGISYDEAEKRMMPTEAELQAEASRERAESIQHEQRLAAVRQAYWDGTSQDSGEFDVMYDVLTGVCKREPTDEQARKLYDMLPADVIGEGVRWGFTDTVVRDAIHVFVEENKVEVVAAVFSES